MRKARITGLALAVILVASYLLSPTSAFAEGPNFTGDAIVAVSGQSTNGHLIAEYAWVKRASGGNHEIFVAFTVSGPAHSKNVNNLSYNGVDLFEDSQKPEEGVDYWKLTSGLTVNDYEPKQGVADWFVFRYGPLTLLDSMTVGVTMEEGGFSIEGVTVPINYYTVTYDPNGGVGVLTDPNPIYVSEQIVTVLANHDAITKKGNKFSCWNTMPDGSGISYAEGVNFPMPDHDVVLYAQWVPRTLTITAVDKSKVYGDEFTGFGYMVDGEDSEYPIAINSITIESLGADWNAPVGSYPIVPKDAVGEGLENYETILYNGGILSVTPASLTITAKDVSKIYNGVPYSGGNGVTYAGFVGDENEGVLRGTLTYSDSSQGAVSVGRYVIAPRGLTSANYDIIFVPGELGLTPRPIQVTAHDKSKVYGSDDPTLTYQVTSGELVEGDGFTGAIARAPGEDVGLYAIQQGNLALSDNYTLTFVDGQLEITKVTLPVTGINEYKYYILGLLAMLFGIILATKARILTN